MSKKKVSLYQSLKEFCNDHYPKKYNKLFYLDERDMLEPSLELFFYNLYRKFRGWLPVYRLRMLFQFISRKNHIPDCWIWNTYEIIARKTLPLLLAFRNSKRHSYPCEYGEWDEGCSQSREEWEKWNGKSIGGRIDAWNKDLDEMIFAFEYTLNRDDWGSSFWKKYYGEYLDEAKSENKHTSIHYHLPDDEKKHLGGRIIFNREELEPGAVITEEFSYYHNSNIEKLAGERAQKGLELYAKKFFSLWD